MALEPETPRTGRHSIILQKFMLHYIVLYDKRLCHIVLHSSEYLISDYVILGCSKLCFIYHIAFQYTILDQTRLDEARLCSAILYYKMKYYVVFCIRMHEILYCTVLYYGMVDYMASY